MTAIEWGPRSGVIVTGGASGIGCASARALAEIGRPVAIWDLSAERCEEVAEQIARDFGVPTSASGFDIREHDRFEAELLRARTALGELGGLVHSAGISHPIPVDELEPEDWDSVLGINLRAQALLVRAMLPDLRKSEGAAIVGVASINAILGNGLNPAYGASKAGLLGLTRSLADRLGPDGIRVNAVCPGYIRTPMQDDALQNVPGLEERYVHQSMLGRMGEPEEIGSVVRFLLSSQASFITAAHFVVDGGVVPSQH
jgi:NAD(P)-dependent dehydrogenase (short-subunit alcohol dehydrogenase family)